MKSLQIKEKDILRIALDENCPKCNFPEIGGMGTLKTGIVKKYCRKCGWEVWKNGKVFKNLKK